MATINESTVSSTSPVHRRSKSHLQPLPPRISSSIDRHFKQYLRDHHRFACLPSIHRTNVTHHDEVENSIIDRNKLLSSHPRTNPVDNQSISRLLNSENYRRAQARLIEYRQQSKIPGVALTPPLLIINETLQHHPDGSIPLKDVIMETTRAHQQQQHDEVDLVDDDSVISHETDRRRRAKHWVKEHQFFFTEC